MSSELVRIASWNVNGLRAVAKKGFAAWRARSGADIIGVQEVRAHPEQLSRALREPRHWHATISAAERPGYSGVATYGRREPDEVCTELDVPEIDSEGRLQLLRYGELLLANVYFPNGNGKERDNSRVPYKLEFYRRLFERLHPELNRGRRILVMGDFNTAHREIDLARPKQNANTSGFLPEEREELDRWLRAGFIDTFRHFEPGGGNYTWWSQRFGVRKRNIGWRIDYVLASPGAMRYVQGAGIHRRVTGSDHCPISVTVDSKIYD